MICFSCGNVAEFQYSKAGGNENVYYCRTEACKVDRLIFNSKSQSIGFSLVDSNIKGDM